MSEIRHGEIRLIRQIQDRFRTKESLDDLCLDLGIMYENLSGDTPETKARQLVIRCNDENRLDDLISVCAKKRPHVKWEVLETENSLTMSVISSHMTVGAWNQGNPLSSFIFIIKLDLVNHTPRPVIWKSSNIVSFDVPAELQKYGPPTGSLFIINENNQKIPIKSFPYQIPSSHFGLVEYQIKVPLDDRNKLDYVANSDVFQQYSIELSYEYYDVSRTLQVGSVLIQDTFMEFKEQWRQQWTRWQEILFRRGLIDQLPDSE